MPLSRGADPAVRSRRPCHNDAATAARIDVPNTQPKAIQDGDLIAAVDIGSNSFHMVVARYEHGELRVIDRLRESVRMAAGLRADGSLAPARRRAALDCLLQFGQRLAALPSERVRAVATNTVRRLASPQAFLLPAETALGHPIEVVSGREEARLIYQGVVRGLPRMDGQRLVIDIGGGSTEFIIGRGLDALATESVQVGCIASSLRYFEDGRITARRWQQAQSEIGVELQQFVAGYRARGWSEAVGSSGTAKSIGAIVAANGWSEQGVTAASLAELRETLIRIGHVEQLHELPGLSPDRRGLIAGGVAILETAFAMLGIERMSVCETAMREGLLYDMLGRALHTDPRHDSILALAERYAVDPEQAARVRRTALLLFEQMAPAWALGAGERDLLAWSASVHEVGLAIAHSQHHLHGAYIVAHSDLAGFSRQEQQLLATILRSHRRKPDKDALLALPERLRAPARRLTVLLRLAVLLERARIDEPLPPLRLDAAERTLMLELPESWLRQHPLTRVDLDQERAYLKTLDVRLIVTATP